MPKSASRPKSHQPSIPAVTPETWRQLLPAAAAFGSLAPWDWMYDSELLGLRHPATGKPLLCSVLGRLRQVFALLVYRNDAGRRWILNTLLNDRDSGGLEDGESAFEQDCVKVELVNKRELTKEERAVLAAANFSPAKKTGRVWPVFRSLVPAGYPWYITQAEADLLLYALPRAAAFSVLWRNTPDLEADLTGKGVPFLSAEFDPALRPMRLEDLEWHPQITPPEALATPVSLGENAVARFTKLPQATGFHLELDMFYSPMPITGKERPRFPKTVMAVDRASGFIGAFRMAEATDADGAEALGKALESALVKLTHRPEAIHVQRTRVAHLLAKAGTQLGVPIHQDPELRTLNAAREEMTRMLGR